MVRVDIETIVMAAGPVPSLIVLRERCSKSDSPAPLRSLSIQTGSFEAAAISRGIDSGRADRPITHDLLLDTVDALGAKLERIEIVRAEPPCFTRRLSCWPMATSIRSMRVRATPSPSPYVVMPPCSLKTTS